MSAIIASHLNFAYGQGDLQRKVLQDIHIEIKRGEMVIMTGPSGSGKTTLLTILGGLRLAHQGSAKVLGVEMVNSSERERLNIRRKSGYIFQQHNLLPQLMALQNVCMALEPDPTLSERDRVNKATAMLNAVGLGDHLNYRPAQLSGGQRQRVSIARALVHHPELVLADEPTASLDKVSGQECVTILKKLAQEAGTTILLVTHDYRILDMADRIVELEDGILKNGGID
jgi:putative ABC transport system ATP-binding protein